MSSILVGPALDDGAERITVIVEGRQLFTLRLRGYADCCGLFQSCCATDRAAAPDDQPTPYPEGPGWAPGGLDNGDAQRSAIHIPAPHTVASFLLICRYLDRVATLGAPEPVMAPLPSYNFETVADHHDVRFICNDVMEGSASPQVGNAPNHAALVAGYDRLVQLLVLADFVQLVHLQKLCSAFVCCCACSSNVEAIASSFGLPQFDLDERQELLYSYQLVAQM